jgi:hypothetical protein
MGTSPICERRFCRRGRNGRGGQREASRAKRGLRERIEQQRPITALHFTVLLFKAGNRLIWLIGIVRRSRITRVCSHQRTASPQVHSPSCRPSRGLGRSPPRCRIHARPAFSQLFWRARDASASGPRQPRARQGLACLPSGRRGRAAPRRPQVWERAFEGERPPVHRRGRGRECRGGARRDESDFVAVASAAGLMIQIGSAPCAVRNHAVVAVAGGVGDVRLRG